MAWINKKTGQINWDECERCQGCGILTDNKTGYCLECRVKRGLHKQSVKPSIQKAQQEAEARKYLK